MTVKMLCWVISNQATYAWSSLSWERIQIIEDASVDLPAALQLITGTKHHFAVHQPPIALSQPARYCNVWLCRTLSSYVKKLLLLLHPSPAAEALMGA